MNEPFPRQLLGAMARLSRVSQLIDELRDLVNEYEETEFARFRPRFDAAKGGYFLELPRPSTISLPLKANVIVGDIMNNLRTALDYLVYELAKYNEGREVSNTQFVIESDPKQFEKRKKTNLRGLSDRQVGIVEDHQPYNGTEWIRLLADISNPDKHRHLVAIRHDDEVEVVLGNTKNEAEDLKRHPGSRVFRNVDGQGANVYVKGQVLGVYIEGRPAFNTLEAIRDNVQKVIDLFKHDFN